MKHLLIFAYLFMSALCIKAQTPFKNAAYGYSGEVPAEWKLQAEIKNDAENHKSFIGWSLPKTFSKLEKKSFENTISITAYQNPEIKSIDDLVKWQFEAITDTIDSKKKSMEMSYLAYTITGTKNGHEYKSKMAFAYKNGIGYVFTFTATPGTFDANLPKFQAFLQSLDLTEPKKK